MADNCPVRHWNDTNDKQPLPITKFSFANEIGEAAFLIKKFKPKQIVNTEKFDKRSNSSFVGNIPLRI